MCLVTAINAKHSSQWTHAPHLLADTLSEAFRRRPTSYERKRLKAPAGHNKWTGVAFCYIWATQRACTYERAAAGLPHSVWLVVDKYCLAVNYEASTLPIKRIVWDVHCSIYRMIIQGLRSSNSATLQRFFPAFQHHALLLMINSRRLSAPRRRKHHG